MPSRQHEDKIEEIGREVQGRSLDWKIRKNFPIWIQDENSFGLIDIVAFKKKTPTSQGEVEGYEIEELSGTGQQTKNFEKLELLKKSFPNDVLVHTCQLKSDQNHKDPKICPKNSPIKDNSIKKPQFRRGW